MYRIILAALAFVSAVGVIGQTAIECPDFVPTSDNTSNIAGDWFYSQTVVTGLELPKRKCWRKSIQVSGKGSVTSNETFEDVETDYTLHFTENGTPVDRVHSRLVFVGSFELTNALIYTYLKIVPNNCFIQAVCKTVEGNLGYQIDVMSSQPDLSTDALTEIQDFLKKSNLPANLTKLYETDCSS